MTTYFMREHVHRPAPMTCRPPRWAPFSENVHVGAPPRATHSVYFRSLCDSLLLACSHTPISHTSFDLPSRSTRTLSAFSSATLVENQRPRH